MENDKEPEVLVKPAPTTKVQRLSERELDLIANLYARRASTRDVMAIFGLTIEEIQWLLEESSYKERFRTEAINKAETEVVAEQGWDMIEQNALLKAAELIPHVDDAEKAVRMAALANKAKRPIEERNRSVADPAGKPNAAIGIIAVLEGSTIEASLTRMKQRGQRVIDSIGQHDSSIVPVEDVETFLNGVSRDRSKD